MKSFTPPQFQAGDRVAFFDKNDPTNPCYFVGLVTDLRFTASKGWEYFVDPQNDSLSAYETAEDFDDPWFEASSLNPVTPLLESHIRMINQLSDVIDEHRCKKATALLSLAA